MVSIRYVSPAETYERGEYHRVKVLHGHKLILEVKVNSLHNVSNQELREE